MRKADPVAVIAIGRDSSDYAAHFPKYVIKLTLGPVVSMRPSLVSVYHLRLRLERCASFVISQSGKSSDIVALAKSGSLTIALHWLKFDHGVVNWTFGIKSFS